MTSNNPTSCENKGKSTTTIIASLLTGDNTSNRTKFLLETYTHSFNCGKSQCTNLCNSLKYIRKHTFWFNHNCIFSKLYNHLQFKLKQHINKCDNSKCRIDLCPQTRAAWAILIMNHNVLRLNNEQLPITIVPQ